MSEDRMSRRGVLAWLGGLGLIALIPGCGGSAKSGAAITATATAASTSRTTPSCVLMPELTEGPYYLDLDVVRGDITEDRTGAPLAVRVTVVDATSCEPVKDAAVDLWHCDAEGAYSGVEGGEGTFLRGIQMTDAAGLAEFGTVYPGWYVGRAVHMHVKVHIGTSEEHTGQLFFEDDVTADVYTQAPYSDRPGPDQLNADDSIFGQSGGTTIVAVAPAGDGYTGTVTLGVQSA
jgi:protocatechuate 3,4-dioxygenase beta subunit